MRVTDSCTFGKNSRAGESILVALRGGQAAEPGCQNCRPFRDASGVMGSLRTSQKLTARPQTKCQI